MHTLNDSTQNITREQFCHQLIQPPMRNTMPYIKMRSVKRKQLLRWSSNTRNWKHVEEVCLNPDNLIKTCTKQVKKAA